MAGGASRGGVRRCFSKVLLLNRFRRDFRRDAGWGVLRRGRQ